MNKTQLIKALCERTGMSRAQATAALDALFSPDDGILADTLDRGSAIAIRGFGTFEVRARAPRLAHNPQGGPPIQLPPRRAPAWRPSAALKERLND